ncbi:unnamed protein product [Zymoseptoria tritici ST99CH_3D7]|uniref:Uncharacterized protein n=1 Tax=Zymoseptoria tritici (strain ST99CH_3D7) TaxID=1276538 RepID=A0A1X7RKV4_ZYMT9|nr:unnamed protein product [Zymoseptoria tritici ST99CH_3D7]
MDSSTMHSTMRNESNTENNFDEKHVAERNEKASSYASEDSSEKVVWDARTVVALASLCLLWVGTIKASLPSRDDSPPDLDRLSTPPLFPRRHGSHSDVLDARRQYSCTCQCCAIQWLSR